MGFLVLRECHYPQHPDAHTAPFAVCWLPSSLFPPSLTNREPKREKPHPQPLVLAIYCLQPGAWQQLEIGTGSQQALNKNVGHRKMLQGHFLASGSIPHPTRWNGFLSLP